MGLGGVFVLSRAELASGGGLLLELLLLLGVGKANLNGVLFASDVDFVVVEFLDDFLADRSVFETENLCQMAFKWNKKCRCKTHRAKPTPRQVPFLSLRIRAEQTL